LEAGRCDREIESISASFPLTLEVDRLTVAFLEDFADVEINVDRRSESTIGFVHERFVWSMMRGSNLE